MSNNIYILRDGSQHGPFSIDQINQFVNTGGFALSEMAWHEGLQTWVPLSSIKGVTLNNTNRAGGQGSSMKLKITQLVSAIIWAVSILGFIFSMSLGSSGWSAVWMLIGMVSFLVYFFVRVARWLKAKDVTQAS